MPLQPALNGKRAIAAYRLAKWEVRVRRRLKAAVAAQQAALEDRLRSLTAAPSPWDDAEWADALTELDRELFEILAEAAGVSVASFGAGQTRFALSLVEDALRSRVATFGLQVKGLTARLIPALEAELVSGMAAGEGIDKLLARTQGVFRRSEARQRALVRTWVVGSSNTAAYETGKVMATQLGEPLDRIWLATSDRRTRASHVAADGQRVGPDQPFNIGGAEMMFPHDPAGPLREVMNCRCTLLHEPHVPETPPAPPPPPASTFPDNMTAAQSEEWLHDKWGKDALSGLRRTFYVKKLGKESADEVALAMDEMLTRFPQTGRYVKVVGYGTDVTKHLQGGPYGAYIRKMGTGAYADAIKEVGAIRIAPKMSANASMRFQLAQEQASGWGIGENVAAVVRHEFGHHLFWTALHKHAALVRKGIADILADAIKKAGGPDRLAPGYAKAMNAHIKANVSTYASTEMDELIAEAFAEYTSSPNPRPLATALAELVIRYAEGA